jgi:hypothetical protein
VPRLCPIGQLASDLFFDDMESGASNPNWQVEPDTEVPPRVWESTTGFASSGDWHLLGLDQPTVTFGRLHRTGAPVLPAGARLQFNHSYGFDGDVGGYFDGGVVEYRTESPTGDWTDAGPLFAAGTDYGGTLAAGSGNLLEGREAFGGDSHGYTGSQYDLSSLAGQRVRFAFAVATDMAFGDVGWAIDDVRVYTCVPDPDADVIFEDGFDGA